MKAFVDGKEADIHKTNYIIRSLVIPAGKHKIEFRYEPDTYFTGKSISIGANIFLALILIAGVIGYAGSRKKGNEAAQSIANEDKKEN
jgi:uncharacterized membrane protein YfhO